MKITIDTKEDSPHDIKKVMQILSHLIGTNALSDYSAATENKGGNVDPTPMMNMFDDGSASKFDDGSTSNNDLNSNMGNARKAEKKEEIPKIEFF